MLFFSNLVLLVVTSIVAYIYYLNGGLLLKGATSACFVIIGALNLCYSLRYCKKAHKGFASLTFCALLLSMLGDVILNVNFIIGAVIFAFGHVCYVLAFTKRKAFCKADILPGSIIFVFSVLFLLFMPTLDFGDQMMQIICIIYALIISFMVGKAIANAAFQKSKTDYTAALGSTLFFVSDMMLVLYVFGGADSFINTICLLTYVPAQCIFAVSILPSANE